MKINNYIWENDLSLNDLVLKQKEEIERLNKAREIDIEYNKYLQKEIIRLNNIIKRFEEDLREMYLTFGEFSEEYTEKKIRELKGSESNEHI